MLIDEVDSLCRRRSMKEEDHSRRIKTELLKQVIVAYSIVSMGDVQLDV